MEYATLFKSEDSTEEREQKMPSTMAKVMRHLATEACCNVAG
eukprot:CAMPEP_0202490534 /NCGR_PEP_ID=MMETSP1361-20130828/7912_1 /ASSEMBLY_ACC=CAM_ASM_000849 /TAXON_ID=210615 /ORGANISM="Staurosira complex sp., Strain CCMP2646" /LENGTH=41 /DNA_ID= /DNA_START= /DNA_END= /DNA_ORIENTATION=